MKNRQFSTLKLTSGYIKQFKNKVELDYSNAKKFGKIINLADSQMLRTIREVTDHKVDYELLESWYKEREYGEQNNYEEPEQGSDIVNGIALIFLLGGIMFFMGMGWM